MMERLKNTACIGLGSSRTVEAGKRRAPKRTFSDDLKFSEVDYACKFGGRAKVSKSTGARPNQNTYLIDCPFKVSLRASKDGQNLTVTSVNDKHNHERDKTTYQHLPKQRRLDEQTATEAATLVSMKSNKKLLQSHLTKASGKTVHRKDIHNLGRKRKESSSTCLEDLVSEMKKYEGWSKKGSHFKIATKKQERVAALRGSPSIVGIRGGEDTDEEDPEPGLSTGVEGPPSSTSPPPRARVMTAEVCTAGAAPRHSHLPFSSPMQRSTVPRVRMSALLYLRSCSAAGRASGVKRCSVRG
ncbi:hypothetical protein GJAV_G00125590 [Gymnothorax javanicus]|nr:hypothetical protein GJAV_G00125590 [Gymnothorax javanicus]